MQEDLSRKQLLRPLSYTPNKQTDDNKCINPRELRKTTLEGSRRHHAEAWAKLPQKWASQPKPQAGQPALDPFALRRLVSVSKIYTINLRWFIVSASNSDRGN